MTIERIAHYINGHITSGGATRHQDVTNPAAGQVTAQVALANRGGLGAEFVMPTAK